MPSSTCTEYTTGPYGPARTPAIYMLEWGHAKHLFMVENKDMGHNGIWVNMRWYAVTAFSFAFPPLV